MNAALARRTAAVLAALAALAASLPLAGCSTPADPVERGADVTSVSCPATEPTVGQACDVPDGQLCVFIGACAQTYRCDAASGRWQRRDDAGCP